MLKKAAVVLSIFALFLTACGSGDESPATNNDDSQPTASATADEPEPTSAAKPPKSDALKSAFAPLNSMGGPLLDADFDMQATSADVDPTLKGALIRAEDLPPGFTSLGTGDFSFAFDTPEGRIEMAESMFFQGDVMAGEMGTVVMSAAMIPPGDMDEFYRGVDEMEGQELTPEDLSELLGEGGMQGMELKEFRVFTVPGLGDKGFGMQMVIDMSGFASAFGSGLEMYDAGLAFDMLMFAKGERMYMLMVMWPADDASGVDAQAVAEIMEGRIG